MSIETKGKIKGFVSHEEILKYIREKWDANATHDIKKEFSCSLSKCNWKYKFNEHSEDDENWYSIYGFINFKYQGELRSLYYDYSNINTLENLEYYEKLGLREIVESETTYLSLGRWGSSIEIIKAIVEHFGGGWIDEDDCDEKPYYPIRYKFDVDIAKNSNDWIPVSSGVFPDDMEDVQITYLGYMSGKPYCDAFAYRDEDKWHWSLDDGEVMVKIIAWKYNCEPYRE